jgi:hypothetical protein
MNSAKVASAAPRRQQRRAGYLKVVMWTSTILSAGLAAPAAWADAPLPAGGSIAAGEAVITGSGTVQTGGGFVASALDMGDADFMTGRNSFTGKGASGRVVNAGTISAGQGALVALLGGSVANSGTISVPLGRIALGAGEQIAFDINGDNFLQVAVPSAALFGSQPLAANSGGIVAPGGRVELRAAVLKDAVRNVINMSGSISADSASGDGGTIRLIGGGDTAQMAGTVTVSGTLSARATGAAGNGGLIETSGQHVDLNGARVSTLAASGKAGTWLIDPTDFTVAASGGDITGAALSSNLATGNVTIASSQGAAGTSGDININAAVNWSANLLTLDAYNNINVNAVMSATGTAGFVGITGDTAGNQTSTGGSLLMGLTNAGFTGRLDLAPTSSFSLNGFGYTIITALGADGSVTGTDLQGINGNLASGFVLGANIDATATSGWSGGAGFQPLGIDSAGNRLNNFFGFTGGFNGLGHTIANLTINRPTISDVGLFGTATNAGMSNLGLTGGNVTGRSRVGMVIGSAGAIIAGITLQFQNLYATGTVTGDTSGGLIGIVSSAAIDNSFADVAITSTADSAGGLVDGLSFGSLSRSHASGAITSSGGYAGGLLGNGNHADITDSYATGRVTGSQGISAGGLVGQGFTTTVGKSWASGDVVLTPSGGGYDFQYGGGLVGFFDQGATSIIDSYATGNVSVNAGLWRLRLCRRAGRPN